MTAVVSSNEGEPPMPTWSAVSVVSAPKLGAYAASKFALEAISIALRAEVAARGVRVLVVRPGPVDTPFRANAVVAQASAGTLGTGCAEPGRLTVIQLGQLRRFAPRLRGRRYCGATPVGAHGRGWRHP